MHTLLIDYLGADDNAYTRAVTRKTLCAAVCRVQKPGCKFDSMLVLNGPQGIGKSTLIARLAGEWFSDSLSLNDTKDKTAAEKLQGYWILEIGELAGLRKTEVETLRSFLSRQNDIYRASFGKRATPHLRQCVFFGTTKSVSRFARNTVDSLTTIRKLKENGIECYFEKENIWTFDGKGELLITIMSSLAQEESRSISENCTWGQRKRFSDGKVSVAYSRFLGYDKGPDGRMVINPHEAETVKKIYRLFLEGMTPYGISRQLEADGDLSPSHKPKWNATTVKRILSNEKYKGDALLQKTYTVDYLTKKTKVNEGEIPQYYVEGDHEAIIDPAVFDRVQIELEKRCSGKNRHSGVHDFSGKIKCGQCGSWYGSKVWHSTDKYRKVIWRCNHKYGGEKCSTPHLTEDEIKAAFVRAANKALTDKDTVIETFRLSGTQLLTPPLLNRSGRN